MSIPAAFIDRVDSVAELAKGDLVAWNGEWRAVEELSYSNEGGWERYNLRLRGLDRPINPWQFPAKVSRIPAPLLELLRASFPPPPSALD